MLLDSSHWTEDFLISFSFDQRTGRNSTKLTVRCVEQLNVFRSGSRPNQMMFVGSDTTCAEGLALGHAGLDSVPHLSQRRNNDDRAANSGESECPFPGQRHC